MSYLKKDDREAPNDCNADNKKENATATDPNNLNEDSMCFSSKTSLEEYIIGKQIG